MSDEIERYKVMDCIVLDTRTGLEWRVDFGLMTWSDAVACATGLRDGWRLPTIQELITLIDYSRVEPASSFPGMSSHWYWSSSDAVYISGVWSVYFNYGNVGNNVKTCTNAVRWVRKRDLGSRTSTGLPSRFGSTNDEKERT